MDLPTHAPSDRPRPDSPSAGGVRDAGGALGEPVAGTREPAAVVCDPRGGGAGAIRRFLQDRGLSDAQWYAPRDLNDVDRAVREGRVRCVVFPGLSDVLEGLWNEEIAADAWLAIGVRIEVAAAPASDAVAGLPEVFAIWQRWRRARRRRQAVAGVVLSLVVLAAAFVLVWWAR